jgi:hypothetical protein
VPTSVNGTLSMASIWWLSSDVTIASSLEKIWKPQPSM